MTTTGPEKSVRTIHSGSLLLDCVLGGGWPIGRVVNVVGDRSSGKTLLAIEAAANFAKEGGDVRYLEAEAAFDEVFAQTLGFPVTAEIVRDIRTIEGLFVDVQQFIKARKGVTRPCLYIVDSLDALSDEAEASREITEGSFGAAKAKKLSEFFRRLAVDIDGSGITLMVISQIRDKIGVMFGETKTRSGGRALDFYCSIILWLSELGKIERTVRGMKRAIGINVKARTKKNKVALPFRECEMIIRFGYGIEDQLSNIQFLKKAGCTETSEARKVDKLAAEFDKLRSDGNVANAAAIAADVEETVLLIWEGIEDELAPVVRKYT